MAKEIVITKEGKQYTYKSLNHACTENGSTSGKNTQNALKFLKAAGFDVSSIAENVPDSKPRSTWIEKIINECKTIDKQEIDKLTTQLLDMVSKMKRAEDIKEIQATRTKIEALQNPVVSLEMVLQKVERAYNAHMQALATAETPPTETTE
jgi:beta-lactam-binding protein with PASTA domain